MTSSGKVKRLDKAFLTDADYRQSVLETLAEKRIVVHYKDKYMLKMPEIREPKQITFQDLAKGLAEHTKPSSRIVNVFSSDDQTATSVMAILTEVDLKSDMRIVCYVPVSYLPPLIADWADTIFEVTE
jgi:hypothetical protein